MESHPDKTSDMPMVGATLRVGGAPTDIGIAVEVGVRQDMQGATIVVGNPRGPTWEIVLSEDAGAFLAGYIAGASGVKFGE